MTLLAIDPGPERSGWVEWWGNMPGHGRMPGRVIDHGVWDNDDLIGMVTEHHHGHIVVEMIASYGMPVGAEVFETCVVIGRILQAADQYAHSIRRITRGEVKDHLCRSRKATDANIRQALIDLFPATGGGKTPQIGTKSQPGPLYGIKRDAWAALALAVTAVGTAVSVDVMGRGGPAPGKD